MKLGPYIEKLNNSKEFKQFKKNNSDSFMIAGFFILDFETGNNIHQIDFFIPSKKQIAAFTLDRKIDLQILKALNKKTPEKLDLNTKIDLDALEGILEDEMKNRNITDKIRKIIAVVQSVDGKVLWNLNCVLSGMGILKAHVEDETKSILKMEKLSLTDIMEAIPITAVEKIKNNIVNENDDIKEKEELREDSEDIMKKIKEIEKEKKEVNEMLKKTKKNNIKN